MDGSIELMERALPTAVTSGGTEAATSSPRNLEGPMEAMAAAAAAAVDKMMMEAMKEGVSRSALMAVLEEKVRCTLSTLICSETCLLTDDVRDCPR